MQYDYQPTHPWHKDIPSPIVSIHEPEEEETMSSRSRWVLSTIILTILVITGCSLTSGNQNDDWEVFNNEVYGYSFNYPADCFFGPMPSDCKSKPPEERPPECLCFLNAENPNEVFLQAFLGGGDQLTLAGFTVAHYDSPMFNPPPGSELASWLKESLSETDMYEEIPDEANMEIGSTPAVRIYSPGSPMAPSMEEIYYLKDDRLFRINMLDVDIEINRDLYDQILSTFALEE